MKVTVNEVILTFQATDVHGIPVNDLRPDEVAVYENDKPTGKIINLELMKDAPLLAGILMDTSDSIRKDLPRNRAISIQLVQSLIRQPTDQAFVMDFSKIWSMQQAWTNAPSALIQGIQKVGQGIEGQVPGTAIYDNIAHTCRTQFARDDRASSGNFILLFSDGEDNASYQPLKDAINDCQHANVAIYAFRSRPDHDSSGTQTLAQLANETGGRLFRTTQSQAEVSEDLQTIEADMRNQYRLVFRPEKLKHDGSFHSIVLLLPDRVASTHVRSGYYAPIH